MKKTTTNNPPPEHMAEPEYVRRKLAEGYRQEAENKRWKKKERAAFAQMSDSWEKTLPKNNK